MTDVKTWADGLREMADFVEARPELFDGYVDGITHYIFASSAEDFARRGRLLGTAEKEANSHWYNLTRRFGPHVFQICASREKVCERVQTGTKIVKQKDPDLVSEALKDIPEIETEEPIYEWSCPDSVLALGSKVDA